MKALETVKLVEVTLVLSIETYGGNQTLCGMDYIVVQDEAQVLGWSERDLENQTERRGDGMTKAVIDEVEQWEETYRPITNTTREEWDGLLFETYGDDLALVLSVARKEPRRVWTWVDGDGGSYIINGYHLVNRIGYFITEVEWSQGNDIQVQQHDLP
jgi:hypothetical protein